MNYSLLTNLHPRYWKMIWREICVIMPPLIWKSLFLWCVTEDKQNNRTSVFTMNFLCIHRPVRQETISEKKNRWMNEVTQKFRITELDNNFTIMYNTKSNYIWKRLQIQVRKLLITSNYRRVPSHLFNYGENIYSFVDSFSGQRCLFFYNSCWTHIFTMINIC